MSDTDILAFGAHPDDVELTCGGTIIKMTSKGYRVGIVDLTRGERGTRGTPEIRKLEAEKAAKIMNLTLRKNLEIPDTGVSNTLEYRKKVIAVLREHHPKVVILPPNDMRHPDHTNAERLVFEACYFSGLKNFDAQGEHFRPAKLLKLHHPKHQYKPTFVVDITHFFQKKLEAIAAHESQFPSDDKTQAGLFKIGDVREWITSKARYYGTLVGQPYGEGFIQDEMMQVEDITKLDVSSI